MRPMRAGTGAEGGRVSTGTTDYRDSQKVFQRAWGLESVGKAFVVEA